MSYEATSCKGCDGQAFERRCLLLSLSNDWIEEDETIPGSIPGSSDRTPLQTANSPSILLTARAPARRSTLRLPAVKRKNPLAASVVMTRLLDSMEPLASGLSPRGEHGEASG